MRETTGEPQQAAQAAEVGELVRLALMLEALGKLYRETEETDQTPIPLGRLLPRLVLTADTTQAVVVAARKQPQEQVVLGEAETVALKPSTKRRVLLLEMLGLAEPQTLAAAAAAGR